MAALAKTLIAGEAKYTVFSTLYGVSRDGEKAVLDGITTHWIGPNYRPIDVQPVY